jgi:hypothetical protein
MQVEHIEVFVEEPSAEVALRILLPKITPHLTFSVYNLQSKTSLLAHLPNRLQGYKQWLQPNQRVVVLIDQDQNNCSELKSQLEAMAASAGLVTKTASRSTSYQVVNRIVVEELEAWFFGDWASVCKAYPRVPTTISQQARYRTPDAITGGTWEAFERVLQKAGYFTNGLRKIEAARTIAPHMRPEINASQSFQVFRRTLLELIPH